MNAKKLIRLVIIVLILVGGGIWGAQWLQHRSNHVFENDARITADIVAISSRVDGWVTEVPVSQGDNIRKGNLIAKIDSRDAELKLAELESRLEELEAERETIDAQISLAENQIRQRFTVQTHWVEASAAALATAESQVKLMRSELNRMRPLARRNVVSTQGLEKAETEFLNAQNRQITAVAELQANKAKLLEISAERGSVTVLKKQRAQIEARSRTLTAQIDQQRLNVKDRDVISPIEGVVDKVFVDNGEFVRPGQRLALIHNPNSIWVETNVRETDLRHVELGATVNISVDAYPDKPFAGRVLRIGDSATSLFALLPSPNPSGNFTKISQRVPVKISIEQVAERPLKPGMMVEVEIVIPDR
ncbi:MAG: HlyD family secretion protein [Proteobacteria bacterium]|nr:HlyD family secretion protein [Pseudomonadota bacterium]